jgi:CrcB protein
VVASSRRPGGWIAVAIGGALGTLSRYEVTQALPVGATAFPWAVLLVNLVGCLAVGAVIAWHRARPATPDAVRLFLAVGVCGGLTTFSTWTVTDVLLLRDGAGTTALLDLVASLVGGVLAVWCAFRVTTAALGAPRDRVIDLREAD